MGWSPSRAQSETGPPAALPNARILSPYGDSTDTCPERHSAEMPIGGSALCKAGDRCRQASRKTSRPSTQAPCAGLNSPSPRTGPRRRRGVHTDLLLRGGGYSCLEAAAPAQLATAAPVCERTACAHPVRAPRRRARSISRDRVYRIGSGPLLHEQCVQGCDARPQGDPEGIASLLFVLC